MTIPITSRAMDQSTADPLAEISSPEKASHPITAPAP